VFHIQADNELIAVFNSNSTFFRNAGATTRRGVEAQIQVPLWKSLAGTISYSYSRFRYGEATDPRNNGNWLPGLPNQQFFAALQYLPKRGFFGVLQAQYTGRFFADDANDVQIDPVWLMVARCGGRFTVGKVQMEVFAGVQNLTDRRFFSNIRINDTGARYYEPGAGRMLYVGASVGMER
jgi:iron complex outermembrane recepter protein